MPSLANVQSRYLSLKLTVSEDVLTAETSLKIKKMGTSFFLHLILIMFIWIPLLIGSAESITLRNIHKVCMKPVLTRTKENNL